jgi:hypothetical protein
VRLTAAFGLCTAGGFWKDLFMAEVMADKMHHNFFDRGFINCLLSELASTGWP